MPGPGSDPAASFVSEAHEMGTITIATDDTTAAQGATTASADPATHVTIALWRAVDLQVSALIGRRGSAAVLRRTLAVTRRTHGWLHEPSDDAGFEACVLALSAALAGQAHEESAAAGRALEAAFHDLLSSLVGAMLTTQLLGAARDSLQPGIDPVP